MDLIKDPWGLEYKDMAAIAASEVGRRFRDVIMTMSRDFGFTLQELEDAVELLTRGHQ